MDAPVVPAPAWQMVLLDLAAILQDSSSRWELAFFRSDRIQAQGDKLANGVQGIEPLQPRLAHDYIASKWIRAPLLNESTRR